MNIIYNILEQITDDNHYGLSDEMEIAKGKYKIKTLKEKLRNVKRSFFMFIRKTN